MQTRDYFGCRVIQRTSADTVAFFAFYAKAKDVRSWAGIRRIEEVPDGTQRLLRPTRSRAITKFFGATPENTIPNNLLIAFAPNVATFQEAGFISDEERDLFNGCGEQLRWGILSFTFDETSTEKDLPGMIVDGQHRLYGMSDFEENLPVLVVALIDAPPEEQAFQFIVINNKAVRVPVDNIKAIIADIDETELNTRLMLAGVKYGENSPLLRVINDMETSPFHNLLDWPYNRDGNKVVPVSAIEQAVNYLRILFEVILEDDDDSLIEIFCAIWRAVANTYGDIWGDIGQPLMKKVSINALNEYLVDRIKNGWEMDLVDIFDLEAVETHVMTIMRRIPSVFWTTKWSIRISDNANVRDMIKRDLSSLSDNSKMKRPWHQNLQLPVSVISEE